MINATEAGAQPCALRHLPRSAVRWARTAPVLMAWLLVLAGPLAPAARAEALAPDWNEAAIRWLGLNPGLTAARLAGKPVLLVVYAHWCPTCRAYARLFRDPAVTAASDAFIMVRLDADATPRDAGRYAPDGGYLPRVLVLTPHGELLPGLRVRNSGFRYFVAPDRADRLLALMQTAQREVASGP